MATFSGPSKLLLASDGTLYVSDTDNNKVRKISADGSTVSTYAGCLDNEGPNADGICLPGSIDSVSTDASFSSPYGLVMKGEVIYLSDLNNNKIRKLQ